MNANIFAIALDESNDNTDTSQLLIFVRAINENFEITQELAGLSSLPMVTQQALIFSTE